MNLSKVYGYIRIILFQNHSHHYQKHNNVYGYIRIILFQNVRCKKFSII